jgi:hypothetical protein
MPELNIKFVTQPMDMLLKYFMRSQTKMLLS